jgi:putative membrane protein
MARQGAVIDTGLEALRLAYERTALAWTRTALSLIGFGFGIDKLFEGVAHGPATFWLRPQTIGITMIACGLFALVLFTVEVRQFHKSYPDMPRSMAAFTAIMAAVVGALALAAVIFT